MADQVGFISGYSDATPRSFVTTEDWAAILHTSSPVRNQDDENDISRLNGKLIVACENIDAQQDTIDAQQGTIDAQQGTIDAQQGTIDTQQEKIQTGKNKRKKLKRKNEEMLEELSKLREEKERMRLQIEELNAPKVGLVPRMGTTFHLLNSLYFFEAGFQRCHSRPEIRQKWLAKNL